MKGSRHTLELLKQASGHHSRAVELLSASPPPGPWSNGLK